MGAITIGTSKYTTVYSLDEKGAGGAHHKYEVLINEPTGVVRERVATVNFQKGGIVESGVNGCHNEDLLAIVVHRLQCFQDGPFACRENALALTKIEEALHWLRHRTNSREARGVEGVLVP